AYLTSGEYGKKASAPLANAVNTILSRWSRTVVESVTVDFHGAEAFIAGRGRVSSDNKGGGLDIGSLMGGVPLWVVGKVKTSGACPDVSVSFDERTVKADVIALSGDSAIKTLYGARQVQELDFIKNSFYLDASGIKRKLAPLGYELKTDGVTLYAENRELQYKKALAALIVSESLKYGVLSSETAFVATRKEKGERIAGTVAVANALPGGWGEMPDMARSAPSLCVTDALCMPVPAAAPAPVRRMVGGRGAPRDNGIYRYLRSPSTSRSLSDYLPAKQTSADQPPFLATVDERITVPASGEVTLAELDGPGKISTLRLSPESTAAIAEQAVVNGLDMRTLSIRIYADDEAEASATVALSDLAAGEFRCGVAYFVTVRVALVNDGSEDREIALNLTIL
ncbi:MAG: hypothetical protein LBR38_03700, partial [Synergistaceae bacterium]|nr:hypothetical protein [Synergistaceae bacterium]